MENYKDILLKKINKYEKKIKYCEIKDCIDKDNKFKKIYELNIKYQSTLSPIDLFFIWIYTYNSSPINSFLLGKYDITQCISFITNLFIFMNLFDLLKEFKKTIMQQPNEQKYIENLVNIFNLSQDYLTKFDDFGLVSIDTENKSNIINKSCELGDLYYYLLKMLDGNFFDKSVSEFIKYYCHRLDTIILNAPKLEESIIIYKVVNLSEKQFVINLSTTQKIFNSCGCSRTTDFYEYVKDRNDLDSYSLLEIKVSVGTPLIFANRETSFYGSSSHEIILPLEIKFLCQEKIKTSLCGYEKIAYKYNENIQDDLLFNYFDRIMDMSFICKWNKEYCPPDYVNYFRDYYGLIKKQPYTIKELCPIYQLNKPKIKYIKVDNVSFVKIVASM